MKTLVCEMCSSNDLVKQDGYYVCQYCGTKYSVEEAKKMMIEGTVDVSGSTVKIDQQDKIKNWFEVARRAVKSNDNETAAQYYNMILSEVPNSWEALFYSRYCRSFDIKNGEIHSTAIKMADTVPEVGSLIFEISDEKERTKALNEVYEKILDVAYSLHNASVAFSSSLPLLSTANGIREGAGRTGACGSIILAWGDVYYDRSAQNSEYKNKASEIYKSGIQLMEKDFMFSGTSSMPLEKCCIECRPYYALIIQKSKRIRETDSSYMSQWDKGHGINGEKTGKGCYVATAVYGSYDCPEVWTLRRYRDDTLAKTWYGRAFVRIYYAISPTLVKWFGETEWFKKMWRGKLDRMVNDLQAKGVEDTPYEDKKW